MYCFWSHCCFSWVSRIFQYVGEQMQDSFIFFFSFMRCVTALSMQQCRTSLTKLKQTQIWGICMSKIIDSINAECVRVSRESFPTWGMASSYKTKPSLPSLNKQNLIVRGNIMLIWYSCSSYYWNSPDDNICNRINAFRGGRVLIQVSTPQSTLIVCTHIPPVPLSSRLTNGITVLTGH